MTTEINVEYSDYLLKDIKVSILFAITGMLHGIPYYQHGRYSALSCDTLKAGLRVPTAVLDKHQLRNVAHPAVATIAFKKTTQ